MDSAGPFADTAPRQAMSLLLSRLPQSLCPSPWLPLTVYLSSGL